MSKKLKKLKFRFLFLVFTLAFSGAQLLATFLWAADRPSSSPLPEHCAFLLAADESSLERGARIAKMIRYFNRSTQQSILKAIRDDRTGGAQDGPEIFEYLVRALGMDSEKSRLQLNHESRASDDKDYLSRVTKIRAVMQYFGTRDKIFLDPPFLVDEIAELFSKITSDHHRRIALGFLPSLSEFPPWGPNVLRQAFEKLGYSPAQIYKMLHWDFNNKFLRFWRKKKDSISLITWDYPQDYELYQFVPEISQFKSYIYKRINSNVYSLEPILKKPEGASSDSDVEMLDQFLAESLQQSHELMPEEVKDIDQDILALAPLQPTGVNWTKQQEKIRDLALQIQNLKPPKYVESIHQQIEPVLENGLNVQREQFVRFFADLDRNSIERSYLVEVARLATLTGGNILILGPAGTAKTHFADQFLGHLEGKKVTVQFNQETIADEILGPYNPKLFQEGLFVRSYEQGVLHSDYVVFDEIDKARPKSQPALFSYLADREHPHANGVEKATTDLVIATANRYVSQLYLQPNIIPQEVQPFIDRFDFVVLLAGELEEVENVLKLSERLGMSQHLSRETIQRLRELRQKVVIPAEIRLMVSAVFHEMKRKTAHEQVQAADAYYSMGRVRQDTPAPYKSTRIYSPRSLKKIFEKILEGIVVQRWIYSGGQDSLVAGYEDLKALKLFLTMVGPCSESCGYFQKSAIDAHEKAQYDFVQLEAKLFQEALNSVMNSHHGTTVQARLEQLHLNVKKILSEQDHNQDLQKLVDGTLQVADSLIRDLNFPQRNNELEGAHIYIAKNFIQIKNSVLEAIQAIQKHLIK